jgi:hypothetical protein
MNPATIGKIQLVIGIILLLTSIFGTSILINYEYESARRGMTLVMKATPGITIEGVKTAGEETNATKQVNMASSVIGTMVAKETLMLIIAFGILLGVLSIILILEGLANMSRK